MVLSLFTLTSAKPLNVVSHCKLFARLQSCGVNGNLSKWLRNLFTGRTLVRTKLKFCSSLSDVADLVSGIVQAGQRHRTNRVFIIVISDFESTCLICC